jgi:hypothetical protein
VPLYVAAARVKDEVGWHRSEGTGEVVGIERDMRDVAMWGQHDVGGDPRYTTAW